MLRALGGRKRLRPFGAPKPNSEVRKAFMFGVLKLTLRARSYDWQFIPAAGVRSLMPALGRAIKCRLWGLARFGRLRSANVPILLAAASQIGLIGAARIMAEGFSSQLIKHFARGGA